MKSFFIAACALAAALVPASAYTSRKTGFTEFAEIEELIVERNTMGSTCMALSEIKRCIPVSRTIKSQLLGTDCYMDGFALDTPQLTVQCTSTVKSTPRSIDYSDSVIRATEQLTVQSAIARRGKKQNKNSSDIDGRELSTSTIGTYEVTQLKARLA
jgi:hypothetical protein